MKTKFLLSLLAVFSAWFLSAATGTSTEKFSVRDRQNVSLAANGGKATVQGGGSEAASAAGRLIDGDLSSESTVTLEGLPATVTIELEQPRVVNTLRLHSGIANYLNYPSGDLSVTSCRIECFSTASGGWREISSLSTGAPQAKDAEEEDEERFWQIDFDPLEAKALRVTILGSSDTGKRVLGTAEGRTAILREIELFCKESGGGSVGLASMLQAEYRLPVYREQETAGLHAILADNAEPLELELSFRERWTGAVPAAPMVVTLHPGENVINVDIRGWANGEYRTLLRAAGEKASVRGEFARLLRLDRLAPPLPPQFLPDMSGKRMYFPDPWYFSNHDGLDFKMFKPEVHLLDLPRVSHPKAYVKLGSTLYFTKEGRLVVSFNEYTQMWEEVGGHYASCTPGEWKWELLPGKPAPEEIALENNGELRNCALKTAHSGGIPGSTVGNEGKFRLYDAKKDGPVDLSQLVVQYVGYKPLDWGVVKPSPQSTWLVWHKGDEYILIKDKSFLQDNISGNEFEDLTDTNDNFAGQWLSEDGKTLFYVRGHMMKRYAPFIARYDNLWMASRILTVFYTHDGINWQRHYYALPDESDPPNEQHYGSSLYRMPGGDRLLVGFMMPYKAMEQQYDVELTWSWDGMKWNRFPGHERWIPCAEPDGPNFGLTNMHDNIVEKDGMVYHEIGWAEPTPHFSYEIINTDKLGVATGEDLRKLFEKRGLDKNWPYFKFYGSWDKLAESWNTLTSTCGVAVYRKGGLFGAVAGEKEATFTTRPVTACGRATVNMKVLDGGSAVFSLLNEKGEVLVTREVQGDGIALPLFDSLPAGKFQISARLRNAQLFSINFE